MTTARRTATRRRRRRMRRLEARLLAIGYQVPCQNRPRPLDDYVERLSYAARRLGA